MNKQATQHLRLKKWGLKIPPFSKRVVFTREKYGLKSWDQRPGFLKNPKIRRSTLYAGPWVGEFGWELMNWQGLIRKLSGFYENVVVACRDTSRALYQDFNPEFVSHNIQGNSNCHTLFQVKNMEEWERVITEIPDDVDYLPPLKYVPSQVQKFIPYGKPDEELKTDILIHARGRDFMNDRNMPVDKWVSILEPFIEQGHVIGSIGLSGDTRDIPGVQDFRDQPLERVMNIIASSRGVIGPSSGPLHLASLCGTPHIVWTDRISYSMGKTSREKYEQWWNPLSTPVKVLDEYGFNPPELAVHDQIQRLLLQ